jgi:HK97 family phage major capsid protein
VALTPNRIGTYTEVSKKLLVQSSLSVELLIRKLLADSIALGIDLAALHGTGSGDQPTGIAATSGIGSVAGGTNGLAPAWSHIVELETDVAVANGDVGKMGYLTNAKVRGKLKQVFTNATYGEIPLWKDNQVNGYRAEVSNQVSSTLTKGTSDVCSALFFGNWADLLCAFWGGLDMVIDPYTLATTNLTRITANTYADVGVRHAASFSAMLDALTA